MEGDDDGIWPQVLLSDSLQEALSRSGVGDVGVGGVAVGGGVKVSHAAAVIKSDLLIPHLITAAAHTQHSGLLHLRHTGG